jgi:hypothetical protein
MRRTIDGGYLLSLRLVSSRCEEEMSLRSDQTHIRSSRTQSSLRVVQATVRVDAEADIPDREIQTHLL